MLDFHSNGKLKIMFNVSCVCVFFFLVWHKEWQLIYYLPNKFGYIQNICIKIESAMMAFQMGKKAINYKSFSFLSRFN